MLRTFTLLLLISMTTPGYSQKYLHSNQLNHSISHSRIHRVDNPDLDQTFDRLYWLKQYNFETFSNKYFITHSIKSTDDLGFIFQGSVILFPEYSLYNFLIKFDIHGNARWIITFRKDVSVLNVVPVGRNGFILYALKPLPYDPLTYIPYLEKISTEGKIIWTRTFANNDEYVLNNIYPADDSSVWVLFVKDHQNFLGRLSIDGRFTRFYRVPTWFTTMTTFPKFGGLAFETERHILVYAPNGIPLFSLMPIFPPEENLLFQNWNSNIFAFPSRFILFMDHANAALIKFDFNGHIVWSKLYSFADLPYDYHFIEMLGSARDQSLFLFADSRVLFRIDANGDVQWVRVLIDPFYNLVATIDSMTRHLLAASVKDETSFYLGNFADSVPLSYDCSQTMFKKGQPIFIDYLHPLSYPLQAPPLESIEVPLRLFDAAPLNAPFNFPLTAKTICENKISVPK